ncbi:hypothetical protein P43SY_001188 [Pythium insidiosum]|uniref:VHS domain-containing protein n=1 Tax=Pythium insidiosum TaxID=114742 RepID=A0AAD5LG69_PYTIN|nr:hypothetical protein P43SY_001188 [Pythium insidiosum]
MVLELIEQWKTDFGGRYPALVAGYSWLEGRGYRFPRRKERAQEEAVVREAQQHHQSRVWQLKRQQVDRERARVVPEMEATIEEMERIFEILVPTLDAFRFEEDEEKPIVEESVLQRSANSEPFNADHEASEDEDVEWEDVKDSSVPQDDDVADGDEDDDVEWEDADARGHATDNDESDPMQLMDINDIVQAYGLGSSSYQLTISIPTTVCERSSENEVLFRHLSDSVLQIRKRFLPLVTDWLGVISAPDADADAESSAELHATAVQLRGLRDRLQTATLKWEDLVKESDRKRFASVRPSVVSLPVTAYDGTRAPSARARRRHRRHVVL